MNSQRNIVSLLSWAILATIIVVSFRPAVPVIWGDTPPFVESAFRTIEAQRPTVFGGRDPGYPAFLAVTFALGGDLDTAVLLQEAAWAILMIALAATAHRVTRSPYSLWPIILLAMYPGLLMHRNTITAETLYSVVLNLAVIGFLLATSVKNPIRCWLVAGAILIAAVAPCFKSQGILVAAAAIPLGVWIAWPETPGRLAPVVVSSAAALVLVATGSRLGAFPFDEASVVFVDKTLFCNHLNIVLTSEAARREIAVATGDRSEAMFARLAADFDSKRDRWPVLGFFGDECLLDTVLDQYLAKNGTDTSRQVAAAYRRIFFEAILDRPVLYVGKVLHQMYYAIWFSWPPYGLEPTIPVSNNDVPHVSEILKEHRSLIRAVEIRNVPVRGWMLSDFGSASVYLFRGLSAAFVAAVVFWMVVGVRGRRAELSMPATAVIVLWVVSILSSAAAHTLDEWRYLVPSTPMVGLLLSILCAELADSALR
jgi:hypothetical protein